MLKPIVYILKKGGKKLLNISMFLSFGPFVFIKFSTGLVGVKVLLSPALQERNTQLLDGTTVEK